MEKAKRIKQLEGYSKSLEERIEALEDIEKLQTRAKVTHAINARKNLKDTGIFYSPTKDTPSTQKALWVELLGHVYNVHSSNIKECALCGDIRVAFGEAGKLIQTEFKK